MAGKLHLEVVSPERSLVSEDVDDVQAPAADGYIGILPGHAPLLTALGGGVLTFTQDGEKRHIALVDGFLEGHEMEEDVEDAEAAVAAAKAKLDAWEKSRG